MKKTKPDFVKDYQKVLREALQFIKTNVDLKSGVVFGTPKQLEDENFVYDSLPSVSLYDKNGLQTDDFAVASIYKDKDERLILKLLGLGDNIGTKCETDLAGVESTSTVYLAQAIADRV